MNELLDKYFAGMISDSEKQTLFQEIERDDNLKEEFVRLQSVMALAGMAGQECDASYSERKLQEIMQIRLFKQRKKRYLSFAKYAAVVVLLISTWFVSEKLAMGGDAEEFTLVEVPKGQQIHITLADQSEVWLSSRSRLKISNKFNKETRNIELDGEAFFVVSKNVESPFVVKTSKYDIKVTGTQFNVFAYAESPIFETDLVEGSVSVYKEDEGTQTLLWPKEKVELEEGILQKGVSSFMETHYVRNGIYAFESKTVQEIADRLELWYDVKIEIRDTTIANSVIRGRFRQTDNIDNILKAIKETGKFNYTLISDKEIELYE